MIESEQTISTLSVTTFLVRGDSTHGAEMKNYCVQSGTKETTVFVSIFVGTYR